MRSFAAMADGPPGGLDRPPRLDRPFPFDHREARRWEAPELPARPGEPPPGVLRLDLRDRLAGTLDLGDLGCAMSAVLVVRGPEAGAVWQCDPGVGTLGYWHTSVRRCYKSVLAAELARVRREWHRVHRTPLSRQRDSP